MDLSTLSDPHTFEYFLTEILRPVWRFPIWAWSTPTFAAVALAAIALRLRRFNRADWPLLSPVIKDWIGFPLFWLGLASLLAMIVAVGAIAALAFLGNVQAAAWELLHSRAAAAALGFGGGSIIALIVCYVVIPRFERSSRPADVLRGSSVIAKPYDPARYFKLRRGVFFGRDARAKPLYLDFATARQHIQVTGKTGCGKGVAAQVLLPQFALAGESVFIFDPKDDKYLPEVLAAFCADNGLPFRLIDLRPSAPPQLNLLANIEARDLATLFNAGFDLGDSGGQDRVYRLDDRRAAAQAAALVASLPNRSLPDLFGAALNNDCITSAKVFWGFFQELVGLPVFATREGWRLEDCVEEGGITYVVGSTLDPVTIMAQKMVLLRVLQLIYNRPRDDDQRWVALFVDEFKYLLSAPAINAFGVVRDFNCHVMVAHQSLGDLEACPGIAAAVVAGAVRDNTGLKLVYRPMDDVTARWAQDLSGTTRLHVESTQKGLRDGNTDGAWRDTEVPLVHRNDLYKLPAMSGVLYGAGTPAYVSMQPLANRAPRPRPRVAPSIPKGQGNRLSPMAAVVEDLI